MAGGNRQSRGEATRTAILHVARRLFSDFGYHNTGIADIQDATGLTKGAFYHHFRAKLDLALAVLDTVQAEYEEQLFQPAMSRPSAGRRLAALLDRVAELNDRPEWCNCRLLVTLFAEVNAADGLLAGRVQEFQADLLARLLALVEAAQADGDAVPGPAEAWAQLLMSAVLGMVLMRKSGGAGSEPRAVMAALKHTLLLDGVAVQAGDEPLPRVIHLPEDAEYF